MADKAPDECTPHMQCTSTGPLLLTIALTALEFLVAFLQAYVFAILTCIYLNDALHMH